MTAGDRWMTTAPNKNPLIDSQPGGATNWETAQHQPFMPTRTRSDKNGHGKCLVVAIINVNMGLFRCPICGGAMHRVEMPPNGLARLVRCRCTCGHCQDPTDDKPSRQENGHEVHLLEGFEELPCEPVTMVHQ